MYFFNFASLSFLLMIIFIIPYAYASVEEFTTDKSVYFYDDQLIISGIVSFDPENPFVTIQIFNPDKSNFADFDTIPVNSDGSFSANFHVGGPTWISDGNYPIRVTYNGNMEKSITFQNDFESSSEDIHETPMPSSSEISVPSTSESSLTSKIELNFTTLKSKIPNFPALDKSPQYYIDRYNDEPEYKKWFDSQFLSISIMM